MVLVVVLVVLEREELQISQRDDVLFSLFIYVHTVHIHPFTGVGETGKALIDWTEEVDAVVVVVEEEEEEEDDEEEGRCAVAVVVVDVVVVGSTEEEDDDSAEDNVSSIVRISITDPLLIPKEPKVSFSFPCIFIGG